MWRARRRAPAGLFAWGSNTYTVRLYSRNGAAWESGLDNSPMYDRAPATRGGVTYDARAQQLDVYDVPSPFGESDVAAAAGRGGDAARATARAAATARAVRRRLRDLSFHPRLSPTSFYPLLAGAATDAQARDLLRLWLTHPGRFCVSRPGHRADASAHCHWGVPSSPASDPTYQFRDPPYFRGGQVAPMAFLTFLGLMRYRKIPAAAEAAAALGRPAADRVAALSRLLSALQREAAVRMLLDFDASPGGGAQAVQVRGCARYVPCGSLLACRRDADSGGQPAGWGCVGCTMERSAAAAALFYLAAVGIGGAGGEEELLVDAASVAPPGAAEWGGAFEPCVTERAAGAGLLVAVTTWAPNRLCCRNVAFCSQLAAVTRGDAAAVALLAPSALVAPSGVAALGMTQRDALGGLRAALDAAAEKGEAPARARQLFAALAPWVRAQLLRGATRVGDRDGWWVAGWRPDTATGARDALVICAHDSLPRDLPRRYCELAAALP
eukprot:gene35625-55559_t